MTYESKTSQNQQEIRLPMHDAFSVKENGGVITEVTFENGKAIFNGVFGNINYGRQKFLNGSTKFRIVAEINLSGVIDETIISKRDHFTQAQFAVRVSTFNQIRVFIANSATDNGLNRLETVNAGLIIGEDVIITIVYDGLGSSNFEKLKVYKNGTLLSANYVGVIPANMTTTNANLVIGNFSSNLDLPFFGNIDYIGIANEVRTAEEIYNDYNNLTYKDITDGLIVDYDPRMGVLQDNTGKSFVNNGIQINKQQKYYDSFFDGGSYGYFENVIVGNIFSIFAKIKISNDDGRIAGMRNPNGREFLLSSTTGFINFFDGFISYRPPIDMRGVSAFVGVTIDGASSKMYIDGKEVLSFNPVGLFKDSNTFSIGSNRVIGTPGGFANGNIGTCRLYGIPLSKEQHTQLYTSHKIDV